MFASAVEYPSEAVTPDPEEYVMWGLSARAEDLGLTTDSLTNVDANAAQAIALRNMSGWAPALRRMVERVDPRFTNTFAVKSARPIAPWQTRNVTLLGDALHNMTPYRGMGANVALRDAAALRKALTAVSEGRMDLIASLAAYERDMIDYGFAAVRASLADMERLHSRSPLQRIMTKGVFRLVDAVPALQRAFRGQR
jgi:2-polyprenyl-6-methoxyphenol hydroxylase-like FAD-dependent oxidoreductase